MKKKGKVPMDLKEDQKECSIYKMIGINGEHKKPIKELLG